MAGENSNNIVPPIALMAPAITDIFKSWDDEGIVNLIDEQHSEITLFSSC